MFGTRVQESVGNASIGNRAPVDASWESAISPRHCVMTPNHEPTK